MKYLKLTIPLLVALSACGGGGKKKSVAETFYGWPLGRSVYVHTDYQSLVDLKENGFEYVEVSVNSLRDSTYEGRRNAFIAFGEMAEKAGLKIWSLHLPYGKYWDISIPDDSLREEYLQGFEQFIELAGLLSPQKLILHPSNEPNPDDERAERLEHSIVSANRLNESARRIGAQLLIEDLPRTCLGNTSDEMLYIMSRVDPSIGVCFDTNHLLQETPQEFAAKLGSRIGSLHISDYDAVDERHWNMGDGVIDWVEVITAIVETGYDGVFMYEASGTAKELADAREAVYEKLKSLE